ncbi:MAG: class I SAM-dependent methyltransferase [Negativicutes bacterium]
MKLSNAVKMAHQFLSDRLSNAQYVVDATAGNGYDTLFLAENTSENATIFAFDIQQIALDKTRKLIDNHGFSAKVRYILDSHVDIASYADQQIDVVMFNLGYLPGGSHAITTQAKTTVLALQNVLPHLSLNGMVSVVAYPGHPAGKEERMLLKDFLQSLPQQKYTVGSYTISNQINHPPVLYMIENVGGKADEGTASRKN